jgi:aminopeptidase N
MEISNFYTATVYNKGSELIRMFQTVLGPDKFRAGTDLYFERHDGQAATCDDFVKALEDASGTDLSPFRIWYSQAGTPQVEAWLDYDGAGETATLHLQQHVAPTPGQPDKKPMPIPLRTALIGEESAAEVAGEQLILLDRPQQSIRFDGVKERPLLSINRGFSAPIVVQAKRRDGELERLAQSDTDPFARYEAMQELAFEALLAGTRGEQPDFEPLIRAVRNTLRSNELDPAFKAEAILIPQEGVIAERLKLIDPDAIHQSREALRAAVGDALFDDLAKAQGTSASA